MTVDAAGFPGNVAADELIESAWGNATANKLRIAPRGLYKVVVKAASQTVPSGVETTINDMAVLCPPWAGRATRVRYALRVSGIPAQPAAATNISILLRLDTGGAVMERHNYPWAPGQQNADPSGYSYVAETRAYPFTAGQRVAVSMFLGGGLSLIIGDSSLLEITDAGPYPPPG